MDYPFLRDQGGRWRWEVPWAGSPEGEGGGTSQPCEAKPQGMLDVRSESRYDHEDGYI